MFITESGFISKVLSRGCVSAIKVGQFAEYMDLLIMMYTNPCPAEPGLYPAFAISVDPDHLASEEATDLDLHCLSLSM